MHGIFQQSQQRQLHSLSAADAAHTDLPRSAHVPIDDVGLACSPVALCLRQERRKIPGPAHKPFWLSLSAPLAFRGSRRLSAIYLS